MKDSGRLSACLIDRRSLSIPNSSRRSSGERHSSRGLLLGTHHRHRDGTSVSFNDNCRLRRDRSFAAIKRLESPRFVPFRLASLRLVSRLWLEIYAVKSKIGQVTVVVTFRRRCAVEHFRQSCLSAKYYGKIYMSFAYALYSLSLN